MAPNETAPSTDNTGIEPCTVFGNVETRPANTPPRKLKNIDKYGQKDTPHLLYGDVEHLIKVISKKGVSRNPERDRLLVWMMFIHGMRVGEVVKVRWSNAQRGIRTPLLMVNRLKGSLSGYHPMEHKELQYWAQWENVCRKKAEADPANASKYLSDFVFLTERGSVMSERTARALLAKLCQVAKLKIKVCPHMLKHSCGVHLALQRIETRRIQMWLGHSNIQNTVKYTNIAATELNDIPDTVFRKGVN